MNLKYISRIKINYRHTDGWQTRMPVVEDGEVLPTPILHSKFFPISQYKNEAACLAACKRYRNKYLKDNNISYLLKSNGRIGCTHDKSKSNSSGAVGISKVKEIKNASGVYMCFTAHWSKTIEGKSQQFTKSFSYSDNGKRTMKQAFRMACAERYKHKGELTIVDEKAMPCFPDVPYKIKG